MAVKVTTNKDEFPAVTRATKGLNGRKINVGCIKGAHQWLAAIHEYGCRINVTDKMRAYLHYIGIHLKPTTTVIVIPERSFIRAGHDQAIDRVLAQADILMKDVLGGTMSEREFLNTIGIALASEIKEYATNLDSPPNSAMTIQQKGSSNPLWDTGQMIGGISYEIE